MIARQIYASGFNYINITTVVVIVNYLNVLKFLKIVLQCTGNSNLIDIGMFKVLTSNIRLTYIFLNR